MNTFRWILALVFAFAAGYLIGTYMERQNNPIHKFEKVIDRL